MIVIGIFYIEFILQTQHPKGTLGQLAYEGSKSLREAHFDGWNDLKLNLMLYHLHYY